MVRSQIFAVKHEKLRFMSKYGMFCCSQNKYEFIEIYVHMYMSCDLVVTV